MSTFSILCGYSCFMKHLFCVHFFPFPFKHIYFIDSFYSRHLLVIVFVCCKCFLPVRGSSFSFIWGALWGAKIQHFNRSEFININICIIFWKSFSNLQSWSIFSTFLLKYEGFLSPFESLIHQKLILYVMRERIQINISIIPLLYIGLFSLPAPYVYGLISGLSILFHLFIPVSISHF